MPPPFPHSQRLAWSILIVSAVAVVVIIVAANNSFYRDMDRYLAIATPPPPSLPPVDSSVQVTIDFGGGSLRAFRGKVAEGMTAYSALAASAKVGHFAVTTDSRGIITSIAGVAADSRRSWHFLVNNSPRPDSPGNLDLRAGDTLTFRYE